MIARGGYKENDLQSSDKVKSIDDSKSNSDQSHNSEIMDKMISKMEDETISQHTKISDQVNNHNDNNNNNKSILENEDTLHALLDVMKKEVNLIKKNIIK